MDKILILGSAPETKKFLDKNPDLSEYKRIYCINNSGRLVTGYNFIHCISSDFYKFNSKIENTFITKTIKGFKFKKFQKPSKYKFGYFTNVNRNMFLNVLYHCLNTESSDTIYHICGCDFDYSREKTHFYNGGKSDPINHKNGTERLKNELSYLKSLDNFDNIRIIMKSQNSLLPFKEI